MYDTICLASGGLDSTVCLKLMQENGLNALPTYINYGQLNHDYEWESLLAACSKNNFASPVRFDFPSFGAVVKSGLTDCSLAIFEDAFTPTRNLLFLVMGGAVAASRGVNNLAIGLLAEPSTIFPDQTDSFLLAAESAISESLGQKMSIHCPLRDLTKRQVVELARVLRIEDFYYCHSGTKEPCGKCVACLEYS